VVNIFFELLRHENLSSSTYPLKNITIHKNNTDHIVKLKMLVTGNHQRQTRFSETDKATGRNVANADRPLFLGIQVLIVTFAFFQES